MTRAKLAGKSQDQELVLDDSNKKNDGNEFDYLIAQYPWSSGHYNVNRIQFKLEFNLI